jgi:hypothetical protein
MMTSTSPYLSLELAVSKLPSAFKYKCTSDSKEVMRNVKNLSIPQVKELKSKLEGELANFECLLTENEALDRQFMNTIETQLEVIRADKKCKELHAQLLRRFQRAREDKGVIFSGVSDWSTNVKSVACTKLMNFIITFHHHKCTYTNTFKQYRGDTTKELKRLEMILNCDCSRIARSSDDEEEEDKGFEEKKLASKDEDIKKAIASIELDVDEDW